MNSIQDIYDLVLQKLQDNNTLSPTSVNTWFSGCSAVELTEGKLILCAESDFKRGIIQQRYAAAMEAELKDLFSQTIEVNILDPDSLEEYKAASKTKNTLPEMDGYTFDNFIVGPSNKFAHAAALGVARNPGSKNYNPLFIYGNSGLGKTHLLLAIGSAVHESDPDARIQYIKGDEFTNQMVRSIQTGTAEEFRQKYRNVDLFLVDDIQFIAGKESTQEEFFHTFNNIYEAGHQIVITSDRPPIDMATLDDRLRTRFESALMAKVETPDLETRIAIISNKGAQLGMKFEDSVLSYIAERVTNNVRQLEGVVKRLAAYAQLEGVSIDISCAERAIADVVRDGDYVPSPETIIEETARYYSVSPEDIKGQKRTKNIAAARHVSIYLIRTLTNLVLTDIAKYFDDRNHSTILSSIRTVEQKIKTDKELSGVILDITSNISAKQH